MQVYDKLYWLDGNGSNAFLYEDEAGFVLVDAGMPKRLDVLGYLEKLGHSADSLKQILITHADIDHIGNLAAIQRATGAHVYASAESAEFLHNANTPSHNRPFMKWVIDHMMKYEPVSKALIQVVKAGDRLPLLGGLDVIAAPGHTSDQIAFHSVTHGIVFAGDALHTRKKKLQCSPKGISADYDLAKQTAIQLIDLAPVIFACGHGTPYFHTYEDVMGLLNQLRKG